MVYIQHATYIFINSSSSSHEVCICATTLLMYNMAAVLYFKSYLKKGGAQYLFYRTNQKIGHKIHRSVRFYYLSFVCLFVFFF